MTARRPAFANLILVLLITAAVIFFLGLLRVVNQLPPLTDHAVSNHGWDAVCVYEWCRNLDSVDTYRWDCGDGKWKYVFPMEQGTWGVYIATEGLFKTITSFPCYDEAYLRSALRGCKNPHMGIESLMLW